MIDKYNNWPIFITMVLPNIGDRVSLIHSNKELCRDAECNPFTGFVIDVNRKLGNFIVQGAWSVITFNCSQFTDDQIEIYPESSRD